jgi:SAM-dependent methyltransferase
MNQQFLDDLTQSSSSFLLENVQSWCSHRPLLQIALELTKGSNKPILELGCGFGSTEQLHKYVETDIRKLYSLDTNKEWLSKYKYLQNNKHELVFKQDDLRWDSEKLEWCDTSLDIPDWLDSVCKDGISVCLVDHACGERRHVDIKRIYEKCDIIVIHDTQPQATGYMMNKIWHLFQYRCNLIMGDDATIISNKYDVGKLHKLKFKNFILQKE